MKVGGHALFWPTLAVLLASLLYGLSGRGSLVWQAQHQQQEAAQEASRQVADPQLAQRWLAVRAALQDSAAWAALGQRYLERSEYRAALRAYDQALQLRGDNAELLAARATAHYYAAGQRMTASARADVAAALRLDAQEVSALMLLAQEAFRQADYLQAIALWQRLLDGGSPRINRPRLIEAIAIARQLAQARSR
ncbi:heme lyase NrfEFG subunit NrfG [Edwardsiella hoshinae]|uniref:Heme lyase NrfEFG subunit NrfG n=1 Tax=Edwardsiella hoshinae TaxID=93378 RepID=A0ABN4SVJ5_9GAMM|nr:hypothetical protein [Edwardsiella hoshinae]AOV96067.1 heme lyase NrfEFG subunit NrfG [Edwardsiella hoshinae]